MEAKSNCKLLCDQEEIEHSLCDTDKSEIL